MIEEEIKRDLVEFNASPYEIVINGEERVGGKIEFSMKTNDAERDPLSSEEYYSILMEGTLVTKYYETDIRSLETRRYYIDGIEVYKEEFSSLTDDIFYSFRAKSIRVKYQETETPEELEESLGARYELSN